ncbi:DUF4194 domain-containing protein [Clostridium estertheticum]|uniref:DUF4194 domain-containing protein n=1 Tax=Clostridium estertheticum TaxID=238834 RepID=UPI0013E9416E|nr:DUF4194 domain-containing protein [Clostridium estertheticum]MBZ9689782.1 DUF4194 domain-containing protein [Clostridium estertheticum]
MDILKESVTQKEKFRVAANKLLNNCFIIKKKEDTRNDYIFIIQNKDIFIEYFDLLGYKIEINDIQGVVALTSVSGTGRLRLKKIESIILLILRLLYIEKRRELSLNEEVVVLSDEIHQKYSMLKIEAKLILDKTIFRDTIRLFKKYNIVTNLDNDVTISDARIRIYPSVLFAITNDNLTGMYDAINEKLNRYVNGGEQNDDEEAMQD